jgi:hypothetical protein
MIAKPLPATSTAARKIKTAIFRQINQEKKWRHHDALEFPDGEIVLLTFLQEGQKATASSARLYRNDADQT